MSSKYNINWENLDNQQIMVIFKEVKKAFNKFKPSAIHEAMLVSLYLSLIIDYLEEKFQRGKQAFGSSLVQILAHSDFLSIDDVELVIKEIKENMKNEEEN